MIRSTRSFSQAARRRELLLRGMSRPAIFTGLIVGRLAFRQVALHTRGCTVRLPRLPKSLLARAREPTVLRDRREVLKPRPSSRRFFCFPVGSRGDIYFIHPLSQSKKMSFDLRLRIHEIEFF